MCGIAGYIGKKKIFPNKKNELFNLMYNRGPDSNGYKFVENLQNSIHFFFTRLAIIDPEKNSNQPYSYKDKTLIFNGEIYNYLEIKNELKKYGYEFITNSDTEVLIKALDKWGINCVNKLEGMWSFFFHDKKKNISYLCRDRFGEKPLFFFKDSREFYFGSEIKFIKCLINKKLEINFNKLENFLKFGYKSLYKNEETYFKNIYSVPAGSYLKITNNNIEHFKYWKIKSDIIDINEKDYLKDLKEKLFASIQLRLRSDFPIAFHLSGGIDSNSLAFIAKKYFNYNLKTFSVIGSNPKYDESKMINFASKNLGADHTNLSIDLKKIDFINILKDQTKYHDSPVTTINSLLNFILYKKIKKDGFKVSITGIGSDEIFSGYYDHHLLYLNEIKNIKNLYKQSCVNWKKIVNPVVRNPYLKKMKLYINDPNFRKHIYQFDNFKQNLFVKKNNYKFIEKKYSKSLMKNRMANEMFNEIVPVVLKEEDLNAMYHSIENRSPYLDTNLFKSAFNMPATYYVKNGMAKWPLRQIIKDIVPDKIRLNKVKTGFNASIKDILKFNSESINFFMSESEIFNIVKKENFLKIISNNKQLNGVENNFVFNFLSVKLFLEENL